MLDEPAEIRFVLLKCLHCGLDDIRSLLSSLSIATSNSTVSTPLSAHEAPKMINTFDTGSFDKDVSSSGLLENPFVDSVANNFKSEAVRKTSDLNNNLASLLYSNLPYFQGMSCHKARFRVCLFLLIALSKIRRKLSC